MRFIIGCISNCRTALLHVGGDQPTGQAGTTHGRPPRLVPPPTGNNLKCTLITSPPSVLTANKQGHYEHFL